MLDWHNVSSETVHMAVARLLEVSDKSKWQPGEFYIACKMIIHFLEKQYGCVWIDEEKFTGQLEDFEAT